MLHSEITASPALAGLALGIALAGAPGPVQAVLLAESVRGGIARGLRAMAGANLTFGLLLVSAALGLSVAPPRGMVLQILKIAGGVFLLWLAAEGFRSRDQLDQATADRPSLHPAARGSLAVLFNPGSWLFLGTVASSLLSGAARQGTGNALFAALALLAGLAMGDGAVVLLGCTGLQRAGERVGRWVRRTLAVVLAGLGLWLLLDGVIP